MAHSAPHHSRSKDKQAGRLVSELPAKGQMAKGPRQGKLCLCPLPFLWLAQLQCSLLNSRGQWWSFTSARSLICSLERERERGRKRLCPSSHSLGMWPNIHLCYIFLVVNNKAKYHFRLQVCGGFLERNRTSLVNELIPSFMRFPHSSWLLRQFSKFQIINNHPVSLLYSNNNETKTDKQIFREPKE